ncbi:ankyrin [Hypoxylon sp. NC1633]|nr:ankyrin [Hypoxylon sp. NC1633]
MGLLQLPVELLTLVAEELPLRDISNFCRSCRAFHEALDRVLYRSARNNVEVLAWAIENNETDAVKKLLATGTNPDLALHSELFSSTPTLFNGSEPRHLQDYQMQLELLRQQNQMRFMLARGIDVPPRQVEQLGLPRLRLYTPLHLASCRGYDDIVNLLLDYGANINALSMKFCPCQYVGGDPDTSGLDSPWWMPLHTAICNHQYATAWLLVSRGASFQVASRAIGSLSNYVTALHVSSSVAAARPFCRLLLDRYRPYIDIEDHNGLTPLAWAFESNQWEMVEFLIDNGACINVNAGNGRSLLFEACASERLDMAHPIDRVRVVERLVESGADVNAKAIDDDDTPLAFAAAGGLFLIVKCLLDAGAEVDSRDFSRRTPLMRACLLAASCLESLLSTVRLLLERGASATNVDDLGQTALEMLCYTEKQHPDKAAIVNLLLEYGSPVSPTSDPPRSLIHSLFMSNDIDICETLEKLGSKPPSKSELLSMIRKATDTDDAKGLRYVLQFKDATKVLCTKTRLFRAIEAGKHNVASVILDAGADWTYANTGGWTCLLHACRSYNTELVQKLLAAGADPNQVNAREDSPLDIAIRGDNAAVFETLLDYGADPFPNSVNEYHTNVLSKAANAKSVAIVKAIIRRGLFRAAPLTEKARALFIVCSTAGEGSKIAQILELFLEGGADPNMPFVNWSGWSRVPLEGAMSSRNFEAVKILRDHGAEDADLNMRAQNELSMALHSGPTPYLHSRFTHYKHLSSSKSRINIPG